MVLLLETKLGWTGDCFRNISETCARHLLSYLRLVAGTWLPPEHVAEVAIGPSVTQLFTCNVMVLALHSCSHVIYWS